MNHLLREARHRHYERMTLQREGMFKKSYLVRRVRVVLSEVEGKARWGMGNASIVMIGKARREKPEQLFRFTLHTFYASHPTERRWRPFDQDRFVSTVT